MSRSSSLVLSGALTPIRRHSPFGRCDGRRIAIRRIPAIIRTMNRTWANVNVVRHPVVQERLTLARDKHTGVEHFRMESGRDPGRWNTLRALRVLRWWEGG